MQSFSHFVGIDWSGAKGRRHAGLAVAVCEAGNDTPVVVSPPSNARSWARQECADWIAGGMGLSGNARTLVGIDSAFSLPFMDKGTFIPGAKLPGSAPDLWPVLDEICKGADDLFAGPFVERYADYYLRTGARGSRFERRMRVTENRAVTSGAGPCESVFHLIGPSQVGLSGLSTIRMLSQFSMVPQVSVWPYGDSEGRSVIVAEIYAAAFASLGGHRGKIRDLVSLNSILAGLNSLPHASMPAAAAKGEHAADAIVTSAGLRHVAGQRKYWHPPELSTMVRRTEGWIFGVI